MTNLKGEKPLGQKVYGSIPHLPGSRMGSGDHSCHPGQERICIIKVRDKHDTILVSEKLDGSNVGVANIGGKILPMTRAGYSAYDSPYEQHRLFGDWVYERIDRFEALLKPGERVVGEWLALCHGTRYDLKHEPFVAFDLFSDNERLTYAEASEQLNACDFVMPMLVSNGPPISIENAMKLVQTSRHGAVDPVEGAVWRVERYDLARKRVVVDFLAKFVKHDKQDGLYLSGIGDNTVDVWNWHPYKPTWKDTRSSST